MYMFEVKDFILLLCKLTSRYSRYKRLSLNYWDEFSKKRLCLTLPWKVVFSLKLQSWNLMLRVCAFALESVCKWANGWKWHTSLPLPLHSSFFETFDHRLLTFLFLAFGVNVPTLAVMRNDADNTATLIRCYLYLLWTFFKIIAGNIAPVF